MNAPIRDKLAWVWGVAVGGAVPRNPGGGAWFVVAGYLYPGLAAVAVARDDTGRVAEWIATGQLRKPTDEEATTWGADLDTPFEFLIVQPFVIARTRGEPVRVD